MAAKKGIRENLVRETEGDQALMPKTKTAWRHVRIVQAKVISELFELITAKGQTHIFGDWFIWYTLILFEIRATGVPASPALSLLLAHLPTPPACCVRWQAHRRNKLNEYAHVVTTHFEQRTDSFIREVLVPMLGTPIDKVIIVTDPICDALFCGYAVVNLCVALFVYPRGTSAEITVPTLGSEPMMAWLIRWAAMSVSRFQVGKDGKTPYERQKR